MGIFTAIGAILFLYLNWRNLRENYKPEELISYSWLALLVFFVGGRLSYGLLNWGVWNESIFDWFNFLSNKGFDLVGGYIFLLVVSYFVAGYKGWKVSSLAEDSIRNFLIFIIFLLVEQLVGSKFSLRNLLTFVILLVTFLLSEWLRKKYRSFVWYRSGKKGFVFFFANFFALLLLSLLSVWFKDRAIFSYLYLGGSLLSLVGLFILGDIWISKR